MFDRFCTVEFMTLMNFCVAIPCNYFLTKLGCGTANPLKINERSREFISNAIYNFVLTCHGAVQNENSPATDTNIAVRNKNRFAWVWKTYFRPYFRIKNNNNNWTKDARAETLKCFLISTISWQVLSSCSVRWFRFVFIQISNFDTNNTSGLTKLKGILPNTSQWMPKEIVRNNENGTDKTHNEKRLKVHKDISFKTIIGDYAINSRRFFSFSHSFVVSPFSVSISSFLHSVTMSTQLCYTCSGSLHWEGRSRETGKRKQFFFSCFSTIVMNIMVSLCLQ